MPESYGITPLTAGGAHKQLIARHTPLATRGIVLAGGGPVYTRGCIVYSATIAGPFAKAATGFLPTATDVIAIVSQTLDTAGSVGNVQHVAYVGPGEFVRETVQAASGAMTAGEFLAIEQLMVLRAMNLVKSAYADVTDAA